jgi:hypothetical protein
MNSELLLKNFKNVVHVWEEDKNGLSSALGLLVPPMSDERSPSSFVPSSRSTSGRRHVMQMTVFSTKRSNLDQTLCYAGSFPLISKNNEDFRRV